VPSAKCYIPKILNNPDGNSEIEEANLQTEELRRKLNLLRNHAKDIDEDFVMTIIEGEMQEDPPWAEIRTIGLVSIVGLIDIANLFVNYIDVELYHPDRKPAFREREDLFGRFCFTPEGKKILIVTRETVFNVIKSRLTANQLDADIDLSLSEAETVDALRIENYDLVIIDPFGLPSASDSGTTVQNTAFGHSAIEAISESETPFIICAGLETRRLTRRDVEEFERYEADALLRFFEEGLEGLFTAMEDILNR
jgi:hypothetical protein